jgi:2-dehydro-3-deoxyphosphogluconate aldolase/(4S)-4-hydroxy-2-oxoglutarate aldolase
LKEPIAAFLSASPVIPVLTIARTADAVPLARAMADESLSVVEVTLRTEAALDGIAAIAREIPEAVVGAGTILTVSDLKSAQNAGAKFAVSPGLSEKLVDTARGFPLLSGVATASEIMHGRELGIGHFKFFPVESSGGHAALKAFAGPFSDVRFCAAGGITAETAPAYLKLANVMCIGGSWMIPQRLLDARDWRGIANLARQASRLRA